MKNRNIADLLSEDGNLEKFKRVDEKVEPRRSRSKRGITPQVDTVNTCFRLEVERHRKIKAHCAYVGIEIGEFFDELLTKSGF